MNMIGKMSYVLNITTDCYRKFIIFFQVLYQIILFVLIKESVSDCGRGNLDISLNRLKIESPLNLTTGTNKDTFPTLAKPI